jgi:PRTRC genetic system protein B
MENVITTIKDYYFPYKGIVIFKNDARTPPSYCVEAFDFSTSLRPMNFHPLTNRESLKLAETLYPATETSGFLHINGLVPPTVLHINSTHHGFLIWYTPSKMVDLLFQSNLNIKSGRGYAPALIWKADREQLRIYAIKVDERPTLETPLFHAPFFNVYSAHNVCMGDVNIDISKNCDVETFMASWEKYFFGSYFTHLNGQNTVEGNLTQIWKKQIEKKKPFPLRHLKKTNLQLQNLIYGKA